MNMSQMFGQKFELQDMKQALTFFPRFSELLSKQMGLATTDLTSLQAALKQAQDKGVMSFEQFSMMIAKSVNDDPTFQKLDETLGNRFAKLFQQISMAIAPVGQKIAEILLPMIGKAVSFVQYLSNAFLALSPSAQQLVIGIGFFTASLGVLITIAGTVIGIIGGIAAGISKLVTLIGGKAAITAGFTKLGAVLTGVFTVAGIKVIAITLAIAAAVYGLYRAFVTNFGGLRDQVMRFADRVGSSFSDAGKALSAFWQEAKKSLSKLYDTLAWLFSYVEGVFAGVWTFLADLFVGAWEIISSAIKGAWQIISSIIMFLIKLLSGDFKGAMYELLNVVIGVVNTLIGVVGGGIRMILSPIMGIIDAIASYLPAGMKKTVDGIKTGLDNGLKILNDGVPLFQRAGEASGAAYTGGLLSTMPGAGTTPTADTPQWLKDIQDMFKGGFKGGGGGGAKGGGKTAAQDFFEGLIEGVKMLKGSGNAELAKFFDISMLRAGLKGKAGQAVVDFVKPIVDEMGKLKDGATFLEQFNQKFGDLAKTADPKMKSAFDAITKFLEAAQ